MCPNFRLWNVFKGHSISVFQFSNVGSEPVGKLEFEFVDAPNVKAIRDTSLNLRLEAGENKEHIFAFNVSLSH